MQQTEMDEEPGNPTEEAPGQPGGTQPASVPGAENPESEEIKEEKGLNTE